MTLRPLLAALLVLTACRDKVEATATEAGSSGDVPDTDSLGHTQTSAPTTGPSTTTTTSTTDVTTSTTTSTSTPTTDATTADTATTTTTTTTTGPDECVDLTSPGLPPGTTTGATTGDTEGFCGDPPNQPLNASCNDPSGCGCASGKCFVIPALGGFCSECLDDDDCPAGCSVPNPVAGVGAQCNVGGPGDGCQTAASCFFSCAQSCAPILSVPGIIEVATCSECSTNADCTDPASPNCTPEYDILDFTGQHACKPNASVPNDQGCSLEPDPMGSPLGDAACQSGHCGQANVMGLLKLGVCGECNADADCPQGQLCTDPQVDLDNGLLIGSECL